VLDALRENVIDDNSSFAIAVVRRAARHVQ
jgi:hypothetical protein